MCIFSVAAALSDLFFSLPWASGSAAHHHDLRLCFAVFLCARRRRGIRGRSRALEPRNRFAQWIPPTFFAKQSRPSVISCNVICGQDMHRDARIKFWHAGPTVFLCYGSSGYTLFIVVFISVLVIYFRKVRSPSNEPFNVNVVNNCISVFRITLIALIPEWNSRVFVSCLPSCGNAFELPAIQHHPENKRYNGDGFELVINELMKAIKQMHYPMLTKGVTVVQMDWRRKLGKPRKMTITMKMTLTSVNLCGFTVCVDQSFSLFCYIQWSVHCTFLCVRHCV